MSSSREPREVGRYLLFDVIASGGMASIHLGRLRGAAGFNKTVAVKRLHPHLLEDRQFVTAFIDEARIAARIQHPNAVAVIDVLESGSELLLIMEYVHGLSLSRLLRVSASKSKRPPVSILIAIIAGALHGLHAAHEATDELGEPLHIIHRDVSPQNILVGVDGTSRILDFGIAKARGRMTGTASGVLKGKLGYMAPEQLLGAELSRASDIYAMGIVLWEGLTGRRFVEGETEALQALNALKTPMSAPSQTVPTIPEALDAIVLRACHQKIDQRFTTAREMALALAAMKALPVASAHEVGEWASALVYEDLSKRAAMVRRVEAESNRELRANERASSSPDVVPIVDVDLHPKTEVNPPQPQPQPQPPLPARAVNDSIGTPGPTVHPHVEGDSSIQTRRRRLAAAAGGTAAVIVALAIAFVVTPKSVGGESGQQQQQQQPPSAPSIASTAPPPPDPRPTIAASSVAASASVAPPVVVAAKKPPSPPPPPARPVVHAATTTAASPKPNCEPPFVLDPDGTRHWKRECL